MSKLQDNFKNIINDLEQNINNKEDLEYVKTQIYNISMLFMEELEKISELNMDKVNKLISKHKELNARMKQLENNMKLIENDLYNEEELDDDTELGFEIICPYCDAEFEIDLSEKLDSQVECPECNNIIELDWNQDENLGCSGSCGTCGGYSSKHKENYDEDDDM